MNRKNQLFSKLFALLLVGLFFGTALTVLAGNGSGDNEEREDYGVVLTLNETERTIPRDETATYKGSIKNIGKNDDTYQISFGGKDYGKEGITVELVGRDDETVDPNDLPLEAGEEFAFLLHITIDKEEGSYEISMMVKSKTDENVWDAVKTKTKVIPKDEKEYAFELKARKEMLTTTYGVPVSYMITLVNTGNVEDSYILEVEEDYPNVNAELTLLRSDGDIRPLSGNGDRKLEVSLEPGNRIGLALWVVVEKPNEPGDQDPTGSYTNQGNRRESYTVLVRAQSNGDPSLNEYVKTLTTIKEGTQERLSFECYEPEKSIVAGGMAEYFLYLNNYGWAPVKVMLDALDHEYADITAELFLVAPYWIMDYDDPDENYPGMKNSGTIYDPEGNVVYPDDDDILWDDYGGLIPVDEDFSYVIYPYEQVQFLLRVGHLYDGSSNSGDESALYEIGVSAETEAGYSKTVFTKTEVIYNPQYGIEMRLKEPRKLTRPREPVEYIINLENTGNVEEVVELSLGGEAYGLKG
ncbi:MAG: hypothetical protein KAU14_10060, partial [Thermoplasmata archaeon]|nr:hypothetical protein [Thermoplasmata archaeon]